MSQPIDRRAIFVAEYLKDLNATQAAIRAGYSEKTARQQGCRLLTDADISSEIAARAQQRAKRVQVDADTVLTELLRLATVDIAECFDEDNCLLPVREIPEAARRAIAAVEVEELFEWVEDDDGGRRKELIGYTKKVKFWDKKGANDSLGKHLRLFVEKLELSADSSLSKLLADAFSTKGTS